MKDSYGKTYSQELFEEYLKSKGLLFEPLDIGPSKRKRPDYKVTTSAGDVICEVKEISASKKDRRRQKMKESFLRRTKELMRWINKNAEVKCKIYPRCNRSHIPTDKDLKHLFLMVGAAFQKKRITYEHPVYFSLPLNYAEDKEKVVEVGIYSDPIDTTEAGRILHTQAHQDVIKKLIESRKRIMTLFALVDDKGRLPKVRASCNPEIARGGTETFLCSVLSEGEVDFSVDWILKAEELVGIEIEFDSEHQWIIPPPYTFCSNLAEQFRKMINTHTREQLKDFHCPRVVVISYAKEVQYLCDGGGDRFFLFSAAFGDPQIRLPVGRYVASGAKSELVIDGKNALFHRSKNRSISAIALLYREKGKLCLDVVPNPWADYEYPAGALCEDELLSPSFRAL